MKISNEYLWFGYKGLFFCRNNSWLIKTRNSQYQNGCWYSLPKVPQMPQNVSVRFVCPSPKFWCIVEKWFHWAFLVRVHLCRFFLPSEFCLNSLNNCYPTYLNVLVDITDLRLPAFYLLYYFCLWKKNLSLFWFWRK